MAQRKSASPKEKREKGERDRAEVAAANVKERRERAEKVARAAALAEIPEGRGMMLLMGVLTIFLTGARLMAGKIVGFGDSEALYASYALFPQAAYLDHPGLIGIVARAIGAGHAPRPIDAHSITTTLAMFTPWLGYAAARALGSSRRGAAITGVALTVVPVMAVGLFALTPDSLLAPAWLATLAFAMQGMRAEKNSLKSATSFMAAGFLAGVATSAKVSGICLMISLAIAYAKMKKGTRSRWPWLGLVVGCIVLVPIVTFEQSHSFAMFRHRLIDTQHGGPSLGSMGTVLGGQLLYISPIFLGLSLFIGRALYRQRKDTDAPTTLLFWNMLVSLAVLLPVSLLSRGAEPHWLAPIFLPIAIYVSTF